MPVPNRTDAGEQENNEKGRHERQCAETWDVEGGGEGEDWQDDVVERVLRATRKGGGSRGEGSKACLCLSVYGGERKKS